MNLIIPLCFIILLLPAALHATQSMVIDSEGYACMGDDKSRKETEQFAMLEARRKAGETALTYIQTETHIKDAMLEKDLVNAYANAQVKLLQELLKEWFKDPSSGDCYRVKLKVEVTPDDRAMAKLAKSKGPGLLDDPAAPLAVKIWTDKDRYRSGENVKLYIKGNRPFYAKVVYKDAGGNLVQILPNPWRKDNYFNGGTVYQLPSGDDRFDMNVCAPYGTENVTLYASNLPLGELDVVPSGGVYAIRTRERDVAFSTRGIKIQSKGSSGLPAAAEFAEAQQNLSTCSR
ncbi:MAG: DUF4384 domain-containing protein [Geobacteraceae bacterium]|nr:DUF4384 domain-containing protein [Geobacteraceae bacterium]